MRRTSPNLSALAALALATTLSAGPLAAQQRVTMPAKDRALPLQTRTLFQVGELEGEDYETFAGITDVAFDARGHLYVLDATAHRVVVFDARGRYLRTIGRQGDGPGEFGLPVALAVLPSGELVVNDAAKANLQVFGPDGAFRRTVVLDEALGRATGRMRPSPAGGLVTEAMQLQRLIDQGQPGRPPQNLELPPRTIARVELGETATGRGLFKSPPRKMQLANAQGASGGMRFSMSVTAFEPPLLWAPLADGGIAALNTADYRIALVDRQGRTTRFVERPIQPRKVTNADKKRFLENQKKGIGPGASGGIAVMTVGSHASGGAAPPRAPSTTAMRVSSVDIKESDVTWNDVIPVVSALGTDSFGRLWVQRTAPDLGFGPIDLLDPGLRYLGTLTRQEMPRVFGPDGRLAYITKDDLDVQRVVVKQMIR